MLLFSIPEFIVDRVISPRHRAQATCSLGHAHPRRLSRHSFVLTVNIAGGQDLLEQLALFLSRFIEQFLILVHASQMREHLVTVALVTRNR